MSKNKKSDTIKQITAIIKKYNNDPKREGDELEILIMASGGSITLAKFYREVMKRFDKQDEIIAWTVKEIKKIKKHINID